MKSFFYNISNIFLLTPQEKDIVENEIMDANIQKLLWLAMIAVPINIIHILLFYLNLSSKEPMVYLWQKGIIASHLLLISLFTFTGSLILLIKSNKISRTYMYILTPSVYLFLLFTGSAIAAIDQLVTPAITPYIVVCIITSFLIFIPPALSFFFFTLSYVNFFIIISQFQTINNVLLSNRVNAFTIACIGMGMSYLLWRMTMVNFKQQRQIIEQKKDLENNYKQLLSFSREFERLSRTDDLTGLANRRFLDEYLVKEWKRAQREKYPITIALADIDFFKKYNDNYGHLAGDRCLKEIASILQSSFNRPSDFVARYGGEEFIIVMPNTANSLSPVEKAMEGIKKLNIPHATSSVSSRVTISVGLASISPESENNPETLIQLADEALYQAKADGRNRIVVSNNLTDI